jgi:MFS transporter, DHA2 family, methylenomycin A resistance protein
MGLAVPAMTTAILSSVDRTKAGTASAVLNAARQVGGAIGVAAFGALMIGVTPEEITSGLSTASLIAASLLVVATAFALWGVRRVAA